MASSSSSCSPSSSAVTIPIPGKSILKRPPPTQQSLFSRITRFLPTQAPTAADDEKPLKRAHFILPQISTVYPISSLNPPSTPTLKEEKRAIEEREADRRRRVVRGESQSAEEDEWWSLDKVESFYRECCAGCDEQPDPAISAAFKHGTSGPPRTVDLSGVQLSTVSASILSDVFTIEWGLRKLVFRECDLDEHILKPMLHSLLIPGTLSYISVASNRRLKAPAFRLIGAFATQAKNLEFLDLSQNNLDKKSVEYIVACLTTPPATGVASLRLDDCNLRHAALETLCRAVRTSSLKNISLRHNKINQTGAVALALMIRDYPDVIPAGTPLSTPITSSNFSTPNSSVPPSPALSTPPLPPLHLPTDIPALASPTSPTPPLRAGPILPPPRHPPTGPQTTYTPYIPKSRRARPAPTPNPLLLNGQPVPIITSSSQGGVTMRHPLPPTNPGVGLTSHTDANGEKNHHAGPSPALLEKFKALHALPKLGALRTLDLKGNDLRTGVSYIAQVLKRNRTLKVLNLSENKLDVPCLVHIAEALKYNSCLETLDLSKNPCCGPGLEGIQSLRTAFTLNSALKRLFLSSSSLTSAGAIALAEFLPESTSLLHLDLTQNNLDIASVMALRSGLRANHVMRCLDLDVPPGDEEFARMCRDILNSCIRNTEEAEKASHQPLSANGSLSKASGKGVWSMIEESELAKGIRLSGDSKNDSDIVQQAKVVATQLRISLSTDPKATPPIIPQSELAVEAKNLITELTSLIQSTDDPSRMEEMLSVNDDLTELLSRIPAPGKPSLKLSGLGLGDGVKWLNLPNGNSSGSLHDSPIAEEEEPVEEEVTTPRIDKGKARAQEEPEKVLSPSASFSLPGEETDDEDGPPSITEGDVDAELIVSPTIDRSRFLVEEEGEVFRKGTVLLGPEEMEGDYAGEDLRKELLEAMVERPPPRPLLDEYGLEINAHAPQLDPEPPTSPTLTSPSSDKPPPRPYISRRSSSSSIMSLISPTLPTPKPDIDTTITNGTSSPGLLSPTVLSPTLPSLASPRPYAPRRGSASSLEHGNG